MGCYACVCIVELSNLGFVHLAYYSRTYGWKHGWFTAGLFKAIIYPALRLIWIPVMIWNWLFPEKEAFEKHNQYIYWCTLVGSVFIVVFSIREFACQLLPKVWSLEAFVLNKKKFMLSLRICLWSRPRFLQGCF